MLLEGCYSIRALFVHWLGRVTEIDQHFINASKDVAQGLSCNLLRRSSDFQFHKRFQAWAIRRRSVVFLVPRSWLVSKNRF